MDILNPKFSVLGLFIQVCGSQIDINVEVFLYLFRIYKMLFSDGFFQGCHGESLLFREAVILGMATSNLTFVDSLLDSVADDFEEFSDININSTADDVKQNLSFDLGTCVMVSGLQQREASFTPELNKQYSVVLIKLCYMNVNFSVALDKDTRLPSGVSPRGYVNRNVSGLDTRGSLSISRDS